MTQKQISLSDAFNVTGDINANRLLNDILFCNDKVSQLDMLKKNVFSIIMQCST